MSPSALAAFLGVDRVVAYSVATRVIQGSVTVAMLALVLFRLSLPEQGYYLTMMSLSALQLFTEFGMAYALMQTASHQSGLGALDALGALRRAAERRHLMTTLIGAVVVGAVGVGILGSRGAIHDVTWRGPWLALVITVAAYHQLYPRIALLEGTGRTLDAWRWRAIQEAVGGVALLVALALGARLFSPAISYAARLMAAALQPESRTAVHRPSGGGSAAGWNQVWGFQWRMGISTLAGFLLFQLLGPLLFLLAGPEAAARIGLAMVLCNGAVGVTSAWLYSQAPSFGSLVAAEKWDDLDRRFSHVLRRSLAFSVLVAGGVTAIVLIAARISPAAADRLPTAGVIMPIMAAAVLHHYVIALGTYLRANREEPLLMLYVVGSVTMTAVLALTARFASPASVASAYFLLSALGAAVATRVFRVRRAAWRQSAGTLATEPNPIRSCSNTGG